MSGPATPGQTVGPFFAFALPYAGGEHLVPPAHPDAIRLHGWVRDGEGEPVPEALLEIWQPGPDGEIVRAIGSLRRDGWTFTGWGRAATDGGGRYSFTTLRPGAGADGGVPFIAMAVFARGLLDRLFARVYLSDTPDLATAPLLSSLPPERRATLIAEPRGHSPREYWFDVVLQGERETVFLDYEP